MQKPNRTSLTTNKKSFQENPENLYLWWPGRLVLNQ